MTTLFDVLNVNPAESVQPVQPAGIGGIAQTLAKVASRGVQQAAGQDTRPVGQRVAEATQGTDPNDPASLRQMAQRLNSIGESQRAMAVLQMATQMENQQQLAIDQEAAYNSVADSLRSIGLPGVADAVANGDQTAYEAGVDALTRIQEQHIERVSGGGVTLDNIEGTYKVGSFKDANNNYYTSTTIIGKDGSVENRITPIGGAPEYTDQTLAPVGGSFSETADEFLDREALSARNLEEITQFATAQEGAASELPTLSDQLVRLERMRALLDEIETGGWSTQVAKNVTDAFGVTLTNVAEFEQWGKQQAIASLSAYGANPTEGERKMALELANNLGMTEGLNRAILDAGISELRRGRTRAVYLLDPSASIRGYRDLLTGQYEGVLAPTTEPEVINWTDLQAN